jgi:hypothetical protein
MGYAIQWMIKNVGMIREKLKMPTEGQRGWQPA